MTIAILLRHFRVCQIAQDLNDEYLVILKSIFCVLAEKENKESLEQFLMILNVDTSHTFKKYISSCNMALDTSVWSLRNTFT